MSAPGPEAVEPGLQADQRLLDKAWLRIGAGLVIAGQAMVFSFAINLSEVEGTIVRWVIHGLLIASAAGALGFLGQDLLGSSWASLRERRVSIDLLFLVTLAGAFGGSLIATFTGQGSVYYEVVAILIVVHTAGKMLGARSRVAALKSVENTRGKFSRCSVWRGDCWVDDTPVTSVAAGERVRAQPGAALVVDGVIVSGVGYVDETSITGEWRPVSRGPGEVVWAGSYSVDGDFVVERRGEVRRLDEILAQVERARVAPSRVQEQADRLMRWFLPVVVGVSMATFGVWWYYGPWDRALFNAMAVLLVACPCAMGLATPVAIWGGLARLARWGLVARTGDFLEELGCVDHVCFDKTGTLSTEKLVVEGWEFFDAGLSRDWLRAAVAGVEKGWAHPVALALSEGVAGLRVEERRVEPGLGVSGLVEGRRVSVGERSFVAAGSDAATLGASKKVFVGIDGRLVAAIALREAWRDGATEVFGELAKRGISSDVVSGDPQAREALKGQAGVRGGMSPADKAVHVAALKARGKRVLFLGDGVNDAGAMSEADAAIALRSGASLASAAAGAVFSGEDLRFLPVAIDVARRTRRGVRLNLWFAAGYNVAGMVLAAAGALHPVAAALLMVGSSLFVSIYALRSSDVKT